MTYTFQEDFYARRQQVKRYASVVLKAERQMTLGETKRPEIDKLHVLRAGAFLILYNLIEASARGILQAIHDELSAKRVTYYELTDGIRREVIKGFKRNGNPDTFSTISDLPVQFVSLSLDIEYYFSGNVDAKKLRNVAEVYGFSLATDKAKTRDGADLLLIKRIRNDLAHGDKTYDEVGRAVTARDLLEIGIRSMAYVEEILKNVATYLKEEGYKSSRPTAGDEEAPAIAPT